jgi:hypothetical protein
MRLACPSTLSKLHVFRYVRPRRKNTPAKNNPEWVRCRLLEFMDESRISRPVPRIVAITNTSRENPSDPELLNDKQDRQLGVEARNQANLRRET